MERWLSFDCYGTLVDWRTGIAQGIEAVAAGQSARLLPVYYRQEAEVQAEGFRPYREVLGEALRRAAVEAAITLGPGADLILPDGLPRWPVFAAAGVRDGPSVPPAGPAGPRILPQSRAPPRGGGPAPPPPAPGARPPVTGGSGRLAPGWIPGCPR